MSQKPGAMAGDGIGRHFGQVGEMRNEGAIGHVLAERDPMHFFEGVDNPAVGRPDHDLIAERGRRRRAR